MFFLLHRVICALIMTLCTLPSDSLWPYVTFIITMHTHNDFFTLIMCVCHSQRAFIMTLYAHGTLHGLTVTLVDLPNDIFYPHRVLSAPIITVTLHSVCLRFSQWKCQAHRDLCTPSMTVCDHYSDSGWLSQYDFMWESIELTLCGFHNDSL